MGATQSQVVAGGSLDACHTAGKQIRRHRTGRDREIVAKPELDTRAGSQLTAARQTTTAEVRMPVTRPPGHPGLEGDRHASSIRLRRGGITGRLTKGLVQSPVVLRPRSKHRLGVAVSRGRGSRLRLKHHRPPWGPGRRHPTVVVESRDLIGSQAPWENGHVIDQAIKRGLLRFSTAYQEPTARRRQRCWQRCLRLHSPIEIQTHLLAIAGEGEVMPGTPGERRCAVF